MLSTFCHPRPPERSRGLQRPRRPRRLGPGRSAAIVLVVALAPLAAGGCATKGDVRDLRNEIGALTAQQEAVLAEMERQGRITADSLRTQSNQLVDFQGTVTQSLRRILSELETLGELSGQNQRAISQMRDQLVALQRSVRGGGGVPAGDVPSGEERSAGESAQAMYNAAMEQFTRGSTRAAELGFRQFIQTYPQHELTPLAHFNLADTYVQDERWEDALEEFELIPERFPSSQRVPDALYRIGIIYMDELDRPGEGRRFLERVVSSYPESGAAELAQRALDRSGGEGLR